MIVFKSFKDIINPGEMRMISASLGCNVRGCVKYGDIIEINVFANSQLLTQDSEIIIQNDDSQKLMFFKSKIVDSNCFQFKIDTKVLCKNSGLFFFAVKLKTMYGELYLIKKYNNYFISNKSEDAFSNQLTIFSAEYKTPDFIKGGIIYQIMVDRFRIGKKRIERNDAINIENWNQRITQYAKIPGDYVANNYFYGGNLYGVIEKLDYIKSLGITCIYLCPIFKAYSNHKYDTADYMRVDESFGGDDALKELLKSAQEKGISVILDGVFNHTGDKSIYFNKNGEYSSIGAYQSKDSPYYSWYKFENYPDKYKCWWGIDILPAVNTENDSYIDFICGIDGVVNKYVSMGIKGFRLDVADELSDKFIEAIHSSLKTFDSEALLLGEVWEDASNKISYNKRRKYFRGHQLDGVMNYPLRNAIINFLLNKDSENLANICSQLWYNYPDFVSHSLMNFLGTHDTERILTLLSGANVSEMTNNQLAVFSLSAEQREKATALLKIGYTLIMTLPGVPCIYYGDEVGMEGGRDPFNRQTYPWGRENVDVLNFCRTLSRIRTEFSDFLSDAELKILSSKNGIFSFQRYNQNKIMTVCINLTQKSYKQFLGYKAQSVISKKMYNSIIEISENEVEILFTNL